MTRKALFLLILLGAPSGWCATADDYYNAASGYVRQGLYDKAVPFFKATLSLSPNHALAYEGLARCYYNLRRYEEAYDACQKGLAVYPESQTLQMIQERLGPMMAKPPMPTAPAQGKVLSNGRVIKEGPPLAPVFWIKGTLFSDYSMEGEFNQGVNGWKAGTSIYGATQADGSAGNFSFGAKLEGGYNFDPEDGMVLTTLVMGEDGLHGRASDAASTITNDLGPIVVGLEMDYCRFWPHDDYRFYVRGGVGYYYAFIVSTTSVEGPTGMMGAVTEIGDGGVFGSGDFGVNLGAGYELRVDKETSVELSLSFRYATISQFQRPGDANGGVLGLVDYPDGIIGSIDTKTMGQVKDVHFLTMDLTGVQLGLCFNYYIF